MSTTPPPPPPAPSPPGTPVRTLGFVQATGIGVAAIVGGGIFVLGGVAVAEAGTGAILAFALNGVIALLTAAAFAELATTFPENGGQYVYARRTWSVRAAFGVGWLMTFAHVVAAVLYALGFAEYAVAAVEALLPAVTDALAGRPLRVLTLVLALGASTIYGWRLTKVSAGGGQLENVGKLAVFGVLIAAGLAVIVQRGPAEALAPLSPFLDQGWMGIVAAMGFTFITFQGFELIAGVAGEVKAPRRTIPRAMFASLGVTLAVYLPLLLVVTTVGLAPAFDAPTAMAAAIPETFFAVAASSYLGAFGFWLVIVAAILSTLTALRANLMAASRVTLAMARHRTLPRGLERLDPESRQPVTATWFVVATGGLLILIVPDLAAAGAAASLIFLLTFGITHLSSWQVRRRIGGVVDGAWRAPLFPAVPALGLLFCGGLVAFQLLNVPLAGVLLLVWLGVGALLYSSFLSRRAEALDAAVAGEDPLLGRLRGRQTSVLVPVAHPARAGGLASVAAALAPPLSGRVLLHQVVVADARADAETVRHRMSEGSQALSNALVRIREDGVESELLLTVADAPWDEIVRVAREQEVDSVLLGLGPATGAAADEDGSDQAAGAGRPDHPLDQLLARLPCDVALLHAEHAFDLDRVRRVLIPLSGYNDHARLRARVIGSLARKGLDALTFLHVLSPEADARAEARARRALRTFVADEARGAGTAEVCRASDPIAEVVRRAGEHDLLVLGITRPRGGRSRIGALLARMVRESPGPILIISHPPGSGGRGRARPF
ncbi:MAG: amino acid permease [Gemmatimonadales bacterium]|nr:MAG: amino acid permease [Gemmatimonadales bacterium]